MVPPEAVNHVRKLYANPDDPVFIFLPDEFAIHVQTLHQALGGDPIQRSNAWYYYQGIVAHFVNYELSVLGQEQVLYQGQLHQMLLQQSQTGASRGDAWGYGLQLIAPVEDWNQVVAGPDELDEMGEIDVGEFSGEEEVDEPGDDW